MAPACLIVHVCAHLSLSPVVDFPWWPWLGISDGWMDGDSGICALPSLVSLCCLFFPLQFPMGPGSDGPLGAMAGMEPHHMNGSLGNKSTHSSTYLMSSSRIIVASPFFRLQWSGWNEQGKCRWITLRLILTRVRFSYTARLFSPEFPKQFKWHQQSPWDPEGWWGAEWKLPPLVSERERKSASPQFCGAEPSRR